MSNIEHMVNRFLAWKLPADFSPDAGIGFKPYHPQQTPDNPMWPTGTNLLTAEQARGMFEYVLEGAQQPRQRPKLTPEDIAAEDAAGGVFAAGALVAQQPQYEAGDMASAHNDGFRAGVASVAQHPHEIEVQCPVCNHKFYEWPNDKQPQAEAVPVVDRVYEAAKRLVDHADFQLGGVLSAKSKARDIPSNAASKVKARHLASLRDALAKTPQQAEAVPLFAALKVEGPRFHCAKVYGRIYQVLAVGSNKEDLLTVARLAKDAYYKQFPGTHEYKEPPFEWVVEEVPTAQPKFQPTEAVPPDVVRDAERWRTFLATRPANTHAVINDAIDAAMAKGEKS